MNTAKIVLLSGKGQRFKDAGYKIAKGLIKYKNYELAIHSAKSLPSVKNTIFGIQDKDLSNSFEKSIIKNYSSNFNFFIFKEYTNGQATSCFEILDKFKNIESFYVTSCDFKFEVSIKKLNKIINKDFDSVVFTYKANKFNYDNSESFGWIRESSGLVSNVNCKKRIEPLKNNDFIITGAFYFRNREIFNYYYKKLIQENKLINNETYIDMILKTMVEDNLKVYNYCVSSFRDFGTPEMLEFESKL